MRLIRQRIEKRDGSGTATLLPEEPEDMVFGFFFFFFNYLFFVVAGFIVISNPLHDFVIYIIRKLHYVNVKSETRETIKKSFHLHLFHTM